MPETITMYGALDCEDTQRTRDRLQALDIPFREIDIDQDPDAACFVTIINNGSRSTPTLVIGDGQRKLVVTEPENATLDQILSEAGYNI